MTCVVLEYVIVVFKLCNINNLLHDCFDLYFPLVHVIIRSADILYWPGAFLYVVSRLYSSWIRRRPTWHCWSFFQFIVQTWYLNYFVALLVLRMIFLCRNMLPNERLSSVEQLIQYDLTIDVFSQKQAHHWGIDVHVHVLINMWKACQQLNSLRSCLDYAVHYSSCYFMRHPKSFKLIFFAVLRFITRWPDSYVSWLS